MSQNESPTKRYSPVAAPARSILGVTFRVDHAAQTKASLDVWEGEGGAVEARPAVPVAAAVEPEDTGAEPETSDVIDTIAYIEMQRQAMAKEAGGEAARNEALRKLQEALAHEQEMAQGAGANPAQRANIDALSSAVQRLKSAQHLHRNASDGRKGDVLRVPTSRQNAPRNPADRPRVRRTTGGSGGRDGNR
jgi:hypothetical protein